MKALVGAFNQEKALVEAFSVITNLRMDIFEALVPLLQPEPRGKKRWRDEASGVKWQL